MKRREMLSLLGMTALGAVACQQQQPEQSAGPAIHTTYRWRMATSWPSGFPIFETGAQRFAQYVATLSHGKLVIEVDSASKHKAAFGVFDMVRDGQYEMGHSASYYWKGKDPIFSFFTTLPFGMTAIEQTAWFLYGGGEELMQQAYSRYGLVSLNAGNTGVQMGGWFRKEIQKLQDLQGLKMRIPGLAGEVMARLGVQVINLPAGELYQALERNVIDALEWVGPHLDLSMGFQQIASYYYTGWHEPAAELQILINKAAYDRLPREFQQLLHVAARATALETWSEFTAKNAESFAQLQQQFPNVQIRRFPEEVLIALKKATVEVLDDIAATRQDIKTVWDSYRRFYQQVASWTAISSETYLQLRKNPFIYERHATLSSKNSEAHS